MFAPRCSSPTSPTAIVTRQKTCQTTLDALRHPKQKSAKEITNTEPHDPTKKAGKAAENAPQRDSPPASEDSIASARDVEAEANDSLKITIRTPDEGRLFLEDKQAIEAGVELGIGDLVHALVQISVIQDMPTHARNTVCAVALLLDQMKLPETGEAAIDSIQRKMDDMVDAAAQRAVVAAGAAVESRIELVLEKATDSLRAALETTAVELQ